MKSNMAATSSQTVQKKITCVCVSDREERDREKRERESKRGKLNTWVMWAQGDTEIPCTIFAHLRKSEIISKFKNLRPKNK